MGLDTCEEQPIAERSAPTPSAVTAPMFSQRQCGPTARPSDQCAFSGRKAVRPMAYLSTLVRKHALERYKPLHGLPVARSHCGRYRPAGSESSAPFGLDLATCAP